MKWINDLVDNYYKWLRDNTVILSGIDNWAVVSSPFVGLFNDSIEIYVKKEHEKILLSDNGETIRNLELSGVSINRSQKRKEIVDSILLNYGARLKNDEVFIECNELNFPQKKHNFLTAILELNDLYVMSEPNVSHAFKDDVRRYLDEINSNYTADFISKGSTGLEFTFDFQISRKSEEVVIKSFNSLNTQNLPSFLFSWEDIKPVREKSSKKKVIAVAVVNDNNKDVKDDFVQALDFKGAAYFPWSRRFEDQYKIKVA